MSFDAAAIMDTAALIPSDLIEEILGNLPHKSLVRFSTVSKSWKSMISEPVFARKHKNHAALLQRHRLVVYMNADGFETASFCSLAPISSDLRFHVTIKPHPPDYDYKFTSFSAISDTSIDARDHVGQFKGKPYFLACCDELWCVEVKKCLYLWNPSMGNIVPLPPPSVFEPRANSYTGWGAYIYGLAYDSVNDDYKVLKVGRRSPSNSNELYSLKNHCWKNIESLSNVQASLQQQKCEFVDGKFHWTTAVAPMIASFDLSTEKYGEVVQPNYDKDIVEPKLEVITLRGMLCACVNYMYDSSHKGRFVLWAMEEYGVEKSWTKRFDFRLSHDMLWLRAKKMTPLYLFDNNDLLVKIYENYKDYMYIFMYRNGEAVPTKIVTCGDESLYYDADAFLYVESLITDKNFSKNS